MSSAEVRERTAGSLASLLERCEICEHRCGVDRRVERGLCGLGTQARYYRAFLHHGEEPEIAPTVAVFVTGCSFRCAFCSDGAFVERTEAGTPVVPAELARLVDGLAVEARSVSFVGGNPDENMVPLLAAVREMRCGLPVVWNSNLYLAPGALDEVIDTVQIFVADLKFGNDACARAVARAPRYVEVLHRNLGRVHGARRLIVRHLVMPGHLACCAQPVVEHVARHLPGATLNLLTQYEPLFAAWPLAPPLSRRPTQGEIAQALEMALSAGVASLWCDGREPGAPSPPLSASSGASASATFRASVASSAHPGLRPSLRSGLEFESRVVVRGDGTVVIEHAGEGLEACAARLAPGSGERTKETVASRAGHVKSPFTRGERS